MSAPPSNFPAKAEESSRFVSVSCCPDAFVWHQENKNTSSKSQKDVSLLKKNLVSRNELRGHEVPGVVAVLCESIAGPHQLIAAKKTQPAQSNKRKKKKERKERD